jgi:tetratricopeptide (TPR) repeat protein
MSENYETVKCTCGQFNRRRRGEPCANSCGKCGAPLISTAQTTSNRKHQSVGGRTSSVPIVLCALIIGAVYLAYSNDMNRPPLAPVTPSVTPTRSPTRQDTDQPTPNFAVTQVLPSPASPSISAAPPAAKPSPSPLDAALSLDLPASLPSRSPAVPINDMIEPTPGCPQRFRTYENAREFCKKLDQSACQSSDVCQWAGGTDCTPKMGTFVTTLVRATNGIAYVVPMELFVVGDEKFLAKADSYVAQQRFKEAIALYSHILQNNPEHPSIIEKRAVAMEGAGRRDAALAEYCRVLLFYVSEELESTARQRIAHLTGVQSGNVIESNRPTTAPAVPPTGDLVSRRRRGGIAPFKVATQRGSNYLLKLVSVENTKDQIWIFVRGGETYSTTVPLGIYTLRIASGDTWFGRDDLFGPNTRFFRLRAKQGGADASIERLQFTATRTKIGTRFIGVTIDLQGSVVGNLEQEAMTRKEFDAQ